MDLKKLEKNVRARGFDFFHAATGEEAVRHVLEQVQNTSVGIGGSTTVDQLGLYDRLKENNEVHWHWKDGPKPEVYRDAAEAEVYLSGVNGIAETGELVNIDGNANRVSAIAFGPKKVVMIIGMNKVCDDVDGAMKRARSVAATANAQRFDLSTPCSRTGTCMDCKSPDTICCQFLITRYSKFKDRIHVILVNDSLGF